MSNSVAAKPEKTQLITGGDEEERIRVVSMIDQKPIKPPYLELIPLGSFTKKE